MHRAMQRTAYRAKQRLAGLGVNESWLAAVRRVKPGWIPNQQRNPAVVAPSRVVHDRSDSCMGSVRPPLWVCMVRNGETSE